MGQADLPFPKCFYASDKDGVIVLQNLKKLGFTCVPKSAEGKWFKYYLWCMLHNCVSTMYLTTSLTTFHILRNAGRPCVEDFN